MPFRSPSEQDEWLSATRERNAQLQRNQMQQYARRFILPRIDFGNETRLLPRLLPQSEKSAKRGLSTFNRHLVTGGIICTPVILLITLVLSTTTR